MKVDTSTRSAGTSRPAPDDWDLIASGQKKRGPGRPRKSVPAVDWPEIERLLVHGESRVIDGETEIIFPTHQELARRFNVSRPEITKFAQREKAMTRRLVANTERQASELAAEQAARGGVPSAEWPESFRERTSLICDMLIEQFFEQVRARKVRIDSVADLKTVMQIREQLDGGKDGRADTNLTITLEVLAERHRESKERACNFATLGVIDESVAEPRSVLSEVRSAPRLTAPVQEAVRREPEPTHAVMPAPDDIATGYIVTEAVCSATVAELGYDEGRGIMEVVRHDGGIERFRVPPEVYDEVAGAANVGRALDTVARRYPGVRVGA